MHSRKELLEFLDSSIVELSLLKGDAWSDLWIEKRFAFHHKFMTGKNWKADLVFLVSNGNFFNK